MHPADPPPAAAIALPGDLMTRTFISRVSRGQFAGMTMMLLASTGCAAAESGQAEPLAIPAESPDITWGPCPPIFPAGCEIAVLHGDPSQANADVFLRVPSGMRLPPHTHTSAERMILSAGELTVRYEGHQAQTLRRGDYAFGPAGLPHEAECKSEEACVLFIAFESAVDALEHEGQLR
jgi:quercetin dioxygenase-like cupin family protein